MEDKQNPLTVPPYDRSGQETAPQPNPWQPLDRPSADENAAPAALSQTTQVQTEPGQTTSLHPVLVAHHQEHDSRSHGSELSAPDAAALEYYPLDPRFIPLSRLVDWIVTLVLMIGGVIGNGIVWWNQGFNWVFYLVAGISCLVILVMAWSSWFWPPIEYRHVQWRLDLTGLEIHRGVVWKHRIAVPVARLQHADISQGPLQRQYGLAKLTMYTAGSANASIELDGLSLEMATWLRDQLIRQREALDVV